MMKKFSKIFMIFCVLFSQFSGVLEVLAEEYVETVVISEENIAASIDENKLIITADDTIDSNDEYEIYLTSSYKYNYNNEVVVGKYNNFKISSDKVLGSVLKTETGYTYLLDDNFDFKYNGTYILNIRLVEVDSLNEYTAIATKEISNEDVFEVYADSELIDGVYEVSSDNKEVDFTYFMELYNINSDVDSSVFVNGIKFDSKYTVNYEDMLYGTYVYDWNVFVEGNNYLSDKVIVNYNSDDNDSSNDKILTKFNTMGVKFVGRKSLITKSISVEDFLDSINLEGYDLKIVDLNDKEVETGTISNGMSLVISKDGLEIEYAVVMVGDVNSDGIVDNSDIDEMINSILGEEDYYSDSADVNVDGVVDIFDVTKTIGALANNNWDNEVVVDDETVLDPVISSNVVDTVKIGDTITVRFALNKFNGSMINGLTGKIEYDSDILTLKSVNSLDENVDVYYNEFGDFIVLCVDYNSEDVLMEIEFVVEGASDEEYIGISSLMAAYYGEEVKLSTDCVAMSFAATYLNNVGGDVEKEETVLLENKVTSGIKILSSDSYLSKLDVAGYDIEFSPYTFNYKIKVAYDVNSLDLSAILSDSKASYVIYGNEDFKVGENVVTVVVTAEDGSTHTYTLVVEKEENKKADKENKETNDVEENSFSRTVVVVLIILVIIGLIYLIFKDDEEEQDEKASKKE